MPRHRFALTLGLCSLTACDPDAPGPGAMDHDYGGEVTPRITFSREIAPLLQQHCQHCHRSGGVGPFPLTTYAEALPLAEAIRAAVTSGSMPHGVSIRVDTGCSDETTFEGPRRLTAEEIDTIASWVDDGAPEGDPSHLPPPLSFTDGTWQLGEPDLVVANAPEGFRVPAGVDRDVFRRFVIPTDFDADRHLVGFEAMPGVTSGERLHRVVHHVTLWVEPECGSLEVAEEFAESDPELPGPGFEGDFGSETSLVGMWFPGSAPLQLRDGLGIHVPASSCILMEVHYAGVHEDVVDTTLVGLHFAHDEVEGELRASLVKNEEFVIPAGASEHVVEASRTLDESLTLYAITPHMHQLGTDFQVSFELPDEGPSCFADVAWDFEHQGTYWLAEPRELPAGTTIHTTCTYDNSAANPHQFQDPPQDIDFGKSADHEMCQLTIATAASSTHD